MFDWPEQTHTSPTSTFFSSCVLLPLIVIVAGFAFAGTAAAGGYLDPESAAPQGSMAVAEVLRQQGVTVVVTTSLEETQQALQSPVATTLFVYDTVQ